MNLRKISFVPLYPGESPGDPELGGWRPLPKQFFRHQKPLALSLEDAVKLVAVRLTWFNLRQALKIITQRLSTGY
jgi:hypothetical protein